MVKVLSQAGISLSDVYDVEGSVVGVEELEAREVALTHEMGATIFSERLSGAIRRAESVNRIQSQSFISTFNDLPQGPYRVTGVFAFVDTAGRLANLQLSLRTADQTREIPFFVWNSALDSEATVRIVDDGAAAANIIALLGDRNLMPTLGIGVGQPQQVGPSIVMRGITSAFGAGTVSITAIVYVAFSQIAGISSIGLPVPSW